MNEHPDRWASAAQQRNANLAGERHYTARIGEYRLDATVNVPALVGGSIHRPRISTVNGNFALTFGRQTEFVLASWIGSECSFQSTAWITRYLQARVYILARRRHAFDELAARYLRDPRILTAYYRSAT